MASFFQPIVYNPNTSLTSTNESASRFLIYTNATLSRTELYASWPQFLLLLLGVGAFSLPLLKIAKGPIFSGLSWAWRKRKRRGEGFELAKSSDEDTENTEDVTSLPLKEMRLTKTSCLASVKSFGYLGQADGDVNTFLDLPYDLHIVPIHHLFEIDEKRNSNTTDSSLGGSTVKDLRLPTNLWVAIDENAFPVLEAQNSDPGTLSQWLNKFCVDNRMNGVVMDAKVVRMPRYRNILRYLAMEQLEVIVLTDASNPLEAVDLNLVCGKIYQNACILPNGLRRDFFQAAKLRSSLARAAQARKLNSNFFVGFHDLWDSPPTPAVIRRSHKFSNFNGAILTHGPATATDDPPIQICLGAFDWIKRDEIVQVSGMFSQTPLPMLMMYRHKRNGKRHSGPISILWRRSLSPVNRLKSLRY
jgi:hypothetical protein